MPRLTLTFDNGPSTEVTPFVLDELAARDLAAYFFVVGRQLRRDGATELAASAAAAGHRVGNHSMTHSVPLGTTTDPCHVPAEIEATERLLEEAGVVGEERLFRPFGRGGLLGPHLLSPAAADHLVAEDYTVVLWNSVPRDWEDATGWSERALADLDRNDHVVLVLHDLPTGAMDHLPAFLDRVAGDGVEVTLDLPDSCVPIRRGVPADSLTGYVASK